jgi:hypothetical protein
MNLVLMRLHRNYGGRWEKKRCWREFCRVSCYLKPRPAGVGAGEQLDFVLLVELDAHETDLLFWFGFGFLQF